MKFRTKPILVDAIQFRSSEDIDAVIQFGEDSPCDIWATGRSVVIETKSGKWFVEPGEWIVRGAHGELTPVPHARFIELYEAVE